MNIANGTIASPADNTVQRRCGWSQATEQSVTPIAIPNFEGNGELIIDWVEELYRGKGKAVLPAMTAMHTQVSRVRNSIRHEHLADFLRRAMLAIDSEEFESARYVLLTTLTAFGWLPQYREKERGNRAETSSFTY